MRLLMEPKANTIMDEIRKLLSHNDYCPFYFNQLQARILSGEEEGVFAWIAANYLNRYFDNPGQLKLVLKSSSFKIWYCVKDDVGVE